MLQGLRFGEGVPGNLVPIVSQGQWDGVRKMKQVCVNRILTHTKKRSQELLHLASSLQRGELESGLQRKSLFSNPIITIKTTHPIWLLTAVCFLTFD